MVKKLQKLSAEKKSGAHLSVRSKTLPGIGSRSWRLWQAQAEGSKH